MKIKISIYDGMMLELTMAAATLIGAGVSAAATGGQMIWQGKTNKKTRKWNEKMYGIQRQDALQDWERNNKYNSPEEQKQRLKDAGLNPAMMYGDVGAGGTTAAPVRASDTGSWNPQVPNIQGMGIESARALIEAKVADAQIEAIKANTEKTRAETTKIGGVDTTEGYARIGKLVEETKNEQAKNALIKLQTRAQQLQNQFDSGTLEHRKGLIYEAYKQAEATTNIINNQKDISNETKQTTINQAKASLGDTLAGIALKDEQIQRIITENKLTEEQIRNLFKQTNWLEISQETEMGLKRSLKEYYQKMKFNADMSVSEQMWTNIVAHFIGTTMDKMQ